MHYNSFELSLFYEGQVAFPKSNKMETLTTQQLDQLKSELKWRNDVQKSSSDGKYVLLATMGDATTVYQLIDENDVVVEKWEE